MKKKEKEKKVKKKITINDIKEFFKVLCTTTKTILIDNKILILYIVGSILNGIILRAFTIGKAYSIRPILGDLIVTLVFISFYFLIKKKFRFAYLLTISIISSVVCIANVIYYFYYSSFISITFFSFALTNHDTGGSDVLGSMLNPKFFIFLWFVIAIIIFHRIEKKRQKEDITFKRVIKSKTIKTIYTWAAIILVVFLSTLKGIDYGRLYSQWNREYLVSRFGVYIYQINDMVKSIEPKMATLFGKDKAYKEINEFYEQNEKKPSKNEYTNIFKGKNVIAVHAESMQQVLMNMKINGKEVTPNLNRLIKEGIYFDNFYSQVSFGTSSDTEFTLATSLLPVSSGTVFINYSDREYASFYKELKKDGYYIFSMHANTGDFWNRNIMHQKLGYDKFYDKASYNIDEEIGFGLSDRSFIRQSVDYIKQINSEHEKFYGTLITLSNHTPFDYEEPFGDFPVTMTKDGKEYPFMKDTKLGNYFVSAHYADAQLGYLVELLEKEGLLKDTIIMIYGDHDARISTSMWNRYYNYDYKTDDVLPETDPNYKELDYYWQEINRKVPLIIWSNDKEIQSKYSKTISTAMGMYDVAPTLGNMMGVRNKYAFGSDIINKKDNLVPFPNGNYVTNYVYYNDNKEEYKQLNSKPLSEDYIKKNKEKTQEYIDISNSIIIYNYFGNEFPLEEDK